MNEQRYTRITIGQQSITYYSEQEAADSSHVEVALIRQLQAAQLVPGIEIAGEGRRYSEDDIALLRRARRLRDDLDINLAGIEVILRLCARLDTLEKELEQYRRRG